MRVTLGEIMYALRNSSRAEQEEFVELLLDLPLPVTGTARWQDCGKNSLGSLSSKIHSIITNRDDA